MDRAVAGTPSSSQSIEDKKRRGDKVSAILSQLETNPTPFLPQLVSAPHLSSPLLSSATHNSLTYSVDAKFDCKPVSAAKAEIEKPVTIALLQVRCYTHGLLSVFSSWEPAVGVSSQELSAEIKQKLISGRKTAAYTYSLRNIDTDAYGLPSGTHVLETWQPSVGGDSMSGGVVKFAFTAKPLCSGCSYGLQFIPGLLTLPPAAEPIVRAKHTPSGREGPAAAGSFTVEWGAPVVVDSPVLPALPSSTDTTDGATTDAGSALVLVPESHLAKLQAQLADAEERARRDAEALAAVRQLKGGKIDADASSLLPDTATTSGSPYATAPAVAALEHTA